jgi:hypothetical protein
MSFAATIYSDLDQLIAMQGNLADTMGLVEAFLDDSGVELLDVPADWDTPSIGLPIEELQMLYTYIVTTGFPPEPPLTSLTPPQDSNAVGPPPEDPSNAAPIQPPAWVNMFSTVHQCPVCRRPRFDAVDFVDSLVQVNVADIPAEDMRCPHCWLSFGTTDEDEPEFVFTPDQDIPQELAVRQLAFRELHYCVGRADNDPVRTPCGHLFGRGCLIEVMERVDTLCPICRQELRPRAEFFDLLD